MRKDMNKVLVERSRLGGKYDRKGRQKSLEDLPTKESMKKTHKDRKILNENLNPLKRFLQSKVGSNWDKVYSEISENLKPDNAVQQHVRDHVWDFVRQHVVIQDKRVYSSRRFYGKLMELRNNELYICPMTNILKKYKTKKEARKPYDHFSEALKTLCDQSAPLLIEGGVVYKMYKDPLTKQNTIKNKASAVHARLDFSYVSWNAFFRNPDKILNFFKTFEKKINLKNPYWETYLSLAKSEVLKQAEERKKRTHLHKVGDEVEVSKDGGKTFIAGVINRMQDNYPQEKPTYWVTIGNQNISISPYHRSYLIRSKKN